MTLGLLLRLGLAPLLVGASSLVARRFGPALGGWIAALPFVAGPLLVVIAMEQGPWFARTSAQAALGGIVALAVFANAYAWACQRLPWWSSLPLGWLAYLACAAGLSQIDHGVVGGLAGALASLWAARFFLPGGSEDSRTGPIPRPSWDLLARMGSACALVGTIGTLASHLGPRWSGLLTPFPIATTILVSFTHAQEGSTAVARMLRGYLPALAGLACFFAVLSATLGRWSTLGAFLAAATTTGLIQLASLPRRPRTQGA